MEHLEWKIAVPKLVFDILTNYVWKIDGTNIVYTLNFIEW
jgi:hypothetical protein